MPFAFPPSCGGPEKAALTSGGRRRPPQAWYLLRRLDMATIQASDVLPVRSRISWGAVMAGAVVAVAMYVLLIVAGVALGVTVADRVTNQSLGIGAGIWSTISMLLSLFAGGYIASRISVGENQSEAAVYGII